MERGLRDGTRERVWGGGGEMEGMGEGGRDRKRETEKGDGGKCWEVLGSMRKHYNALESTRRN